MKVNIGQNVNQNLIKKGAFKAATSPFGKDMVSISGKTPDNIISPTKFKELFKPDGAVRVLWKHQWEDGASWFSRGTCVNPDGSALLANKGEIKKLNPFTGKTEWSTDYGKKAKTVDSTPAGGADGSVLIVTNDKRLRSLDGKTGTEQWKFDMDTNGYEIPVGPDGTIFARNKNDLVALNPDGSEKFRFDVDDYKHQVRYIEQSGRAYVESDRGIFAINSDGSEQWHVPGNNVERFPGDPDHLYIIQDKWVPSKEHRGSSTLNNRLTMRDPDTGEKKWEQDFDSAIMVTGSAAGRVFIRQPRKIHGVAADSGRILWTHENGSMPYVKHVAKDGTLFVAEPDRFVALDPGSGKELWEMECEGLNNGPGHMTKDGLLLLNDDKTLYGIDPSNGRVHYKYRVNNGIESFTPADKQGRVYIDEAETGSLIAVDLRTAGAIAKDMLENPPDAGSPKEINTGDDFVEIGGVRLPRRKRD